MPVASAFAEAALAYRPQPPSAQAVLAFAAVLRVNPTLAILRLGGNNLGADGAAVLADPLGDDASMLSELSIPQNSLGPEGAEALAVSVAYASRLRVLDLAANGVGDRGARALAAAWIDSPSPHLRAPILLPPPDVAASLCGLVDLDLSHNGLTGECASHLARGLLARPHLAALRLQHNELGDEGCVLLARAISEGCGLRELLLHDNRVGDEGAAALGDALRLSPCKLTRLDLSKNQCGNGGGVAIAAGLASSSSRMHTCKLGWNKLGDAAGVAFGSALGACPALRVLGLQHNSIATRAAEALVGGAEGNTSLQSLALEGNALPYAQGLKIEAALKRNRRLARDGLPEEMALRAEQLSRTAAALADARQEYERLCRQRVAAERRYNILTAELEGTRQRGIEGRTQASQQRKDDEEALVTAKRRVSLKKAEWDDMRQQWQASLESLRRRKQTEESKVRALTDQCASTLHGLAKEERGARERLDELSVKVDSQRLKALECEDLAAKLLEELEAERAAVENKPQLRKMLRPVPPKMDDEEVALLEVPAMGSNSMNMFAFGEDQRPASPAAGGGAAARPSSAKGSSAAKAAGGGKRPASAKARR
jgi:Ran GTPase-activating protein (RanGAP) involved in mRNA processing and transport